MSIYIGNNNVAKKVKGMYVGIDNVARKVKKGYVGVDGVARQFYSAETIIPFTSSIIPTGWVASTGADEYTSQSECTNKYGVWTAFLNNPKSSWCVLDGELNHKPQEYYIGKLFNDNPVDDTTIVRLSDLTSSEDCYIELVLPEGVSIKPSVFYFSASGYTRITTISGYNTENNTWDLLDSGHVLVNGNTPSTGTTAITTSSFYSKFRFGVIRYNTSRSYGYPSNIKITSGELKIE